MKTIRSNNNVSPHGGAVPILKKIKEFGIPQVIRSCLGSRKKQSKYGYEDIFIAWVLTSLCGGIRLDHISKLKNKLSIIPNLKLPSHDTLGRVMKQLASETITNHTKKQGSKTIITESEYNDNIKLNTMLIKASKRIGILEENKKYTLHIDATFIPTKCSDSKYSYVNDYGYYPMVCCINDTPVFISMRNGNVSAKFQLVTCLKQCLEILSDNKIKVDKVISDSAAYNKDFVNMLSDMNIKFSTRPAKHDTIMLLTENYDGWKETEIKTSNSFWNCDIGDIPIMMAGSKTECRLITLRFKNKKLKKFKSRNDRVQSDIISDKMKILSGQNKLKSIKKKKIIAMGKRYDGYEYKFIMTNDYTLTPEEIVIEYNKRGDFEKKFDYMKNDFGWRLPPFSKMSSNGVFLIAAALANNIFRGIVKQFKKEIPELRLNARLREFQFVFIDVACALINNMYIFYNTNIAYEKLMK